MRVRNRPNSSVEPEAGGTEPLDLLTPQSAAVSAGELRFAQLGIAQFALRSGDPATVHAEIAARVAAAPALLTRAPVVLDVSALDPTPDTAQMQALIEAVRSAGLLPVGLTHGTVNEEALARALELPLFARFRASSDLPAAAAVERKPAAAPRAAPVVGAGSSVGMHHALPVRSGQQVYARQRDLILTAMVGNGAEVIADGSIHVYGTLRGRALAGASGDATARIYCQNFQAELISIAGQYRVFEEHSPDLHGKPVQAWLDDDKLRIAPLA